MALDWGPERVVRTPGASEREESREVAKVRVTKGRVEVEGEDGDGGKCGARRAAREEGIESAGAGSILWEARR